VQRDIQGDPLPHGVELRQVVIDAAREFNSGRYFEAHEVLEEGLDGVPDELWDLFTGLIQIAVGYHKLTQQLLSGALRMLESGSQKLVRYPTDAGGIDLETLRIRVGKDIRALREGDFDPQALALDPPRLRPLAG
jgi:predicted metal-dependent hydrolase